MILPKGTICDKCNNYFSTNIEKPFLSLEPISLLRTYHSVQSRKKRIPPQEVLFCGDIAEMNVDPQNNAVFIGVSPQTALKLLSGAKPTMFFSKGISLNELKNNYVVSRMLIKIFTEMDLYYSLIAIQQDYHSNEEIELVINTSMREYYNYTRYGKPGKIYNYDVIETKPIVPFSNDDFLASIQFSFKDHHYHKMILDLFELQFTLTI